MNIKYGTTFFSALCLSFLLTFSLSGKDGNGNGKATKKLETTKELETITKLTSTIISKQHYRQESFNDNVSARLFNEYFKMLDPGKIYFTKEDIKSFESYRNELDDLAMEGSLDFAFKVYSLFMKRLDEYEKFADQLLARKIDFKTNEEFSFDRQSADWAANDSELKELWQEKIENDLLTLKLIERAGLELEKSAKKNKDESQKASHIDPSWNNKTPEERIKKRIASYTNYLRQYEALDVLELYLSSLARVYDPHSAYMAPKTEEEFNIEMRLSLVGIGAVLTSEDGYTRIENIIPGGPAEVDGSLKSGDRIIGVAQGDGEMVDVIDMPLSKVVRLIRGSKGTSVRLKILDGSKGIYADPQIITITRDTVNLKDREAKGRIENFKSLSGRTLKIGIITLPSFYMDFEAAFRGDKDYKSSTGDIKKILEDFNRQKIDGLIIDLRSNGGGSLAEAVTLTGLFIKNGPVVQIKGSFGDIEVKHDEDQSISYDGPMIVLLNKLSASATEIFAGAVRDYNRAILVGDSQTHGKGVVQVIYELEKFLSFIGAKFPAGSVKFTNAKFYRVNGESTQIKGVVPDISFPSFTDAMDIGEKSLDYALPWDSISAVPHDSYVDDISKIIPDLSAKSALRRANSKEFKLLEKDIESYKRLMKRKTVSLNEEKRWSEYLKEKQIHEEQKKLMKFDDERGSEFSEKSGLKKEQDPGDIYLKETENIMVDYVDCLNKKASSGTCAKRVSQPERPLK
ncbi:MAG: hypothetical protein A2020_01895 [Lentisphaerae bacterium GWF2_45_14]|nr:MAG: hypothetical protein A2020_01895 [Lentisphaerae bacterium GWF2_45_14]